MDTMFNFFLFFYLFSILLTIAIYVLQSYALYKIAVKRKVSNPWISWIPLGSNWILGKIVESFEKENGTRKKWSSVLLTLSLAVIIACIVGLLFSFVFALSEMIFHTTLYFSAMAFVFFFFYLFILIATFAAQALYVLTNICLYRIFEMILPEKTFKYLLISLFVPLGAPICLLKCAKYCW
ncbi:MAG: hypothetical protein E7403_03705 [Ruminococcaceae bacterium]|nr:hypothetical protein [Oscillospiraceae bacterium]